MEFDAASLATLGGALALVGGLIGSAIGIGVAGSSGAATLSEDSGQLRNVILLASLPMTQTFYGLIVLIIIITSVVPTISGVSSGLIVLGAGIITAGAECFSGIYQGKICASGISLLIKTRGKILVNAMMLAVFVELLGVLGLVFSIMTLSMLGLI